MNDDTDNGTACAARSYHESCPLDGAEFKICSREVLVYSEIVSQWLKSFGRHGGPF